MSTHIPYIDYSLIPGDLRKEILIEVSRIMRFKNVQEHENYVAAVEKSLAAYFKAQFAVAVDSGTTALQLSLAALGIGEGDEVIVPAYTYVATALAVTNVGAIPVFADIKRNDLTIDPKSIESRITEKTKAVIPVHIHGLCCDMPAIQKICSKHDLNIIEDASQAHGASIQDKKAGTFGIGCFSLHTSKNLGGIGDAGLIILNDKEIYKKIRNFLVPDSGSETVLESKRTPCTMDAIQAAIVRKKLAVLDALNERKRDIARQYDALIPDAQALKPVACDGTIPVYRDYFIVIDKRDKLRTDLLQEGIETKLGYPLLHLSGTFKQYRKTGSKLSVAEAIADKILLLPAFWGLTEGQLKRVCMAIRKSMHART